MILTITNPFDNQEIQVELSVNVSGVIDSDGIKTVSVSAIGTQVV
jgi:hypothetical protein